MTGIDEIGRWNRLLERQVDMIAEAASGRAFTRTLRVSPNGDNTDGLSWRTAINNPADALDECSTDVNEATQIRMAPQTGNVHYDIDRTGDPTWAANVQIVGSHRTWVKIMNDHDSATSILNLTGYASLRDLNFNLGAGNNGVIFNKGAFRANHLQFVGEDLAAAKTALHLEGATLIKHGKVSDCHFRGHSTYMTGLKVDNCALSIFENTRIHECLKGIHIIGTAPDSNYFHNIGIGECNHANGIGIDIDTGSEQHFDKILFHHNTKNIDDAVCDSLWNNLIGEFPVTITPDNLVGTALTADNVANVFGADTELRAAALATKPFKVLMTVVKPQVAQFYQLRLSADSGVTWFERIMVSTARAAGSALPASTDFIFNCGTRISGSIKAASGGSDTMQVWLKIQEI